MARKSLVLKASQTDGENDHCLLWGVAGRDSISFVRNSKAVLLPGHNFNANETRQFVRVDGQTGTTLGTKTVPLELAGEPGEIPVIDGTATRAINIKFYVVSDQDMECDAMLGSDAMADLAQKYGEEAVSHDNTWLFADEREKATAE